MTQSIASNSIDGYRIQQTLTEPIEFEGVGLHSGVLCKIRLNPAVPQHGIVFVRRDLSHAPRIPACPEAVVSTSLATSLGRPGDDKSTIRTVEHLMSALFALGVTNCLVDVWGPEIPILDGSALPFLESILDSGLQPQPYSAAVLKVLKPIKVYQNGAICELLPRNRLRLTTSVDFSHPKIGLQTCALELTPESFRDEIARARTFGFMSDVEKLKRKKLALGASMANVVAFSEDSVLNPEGLRYADECVRHKLLDAIGDLALCGAWIQGELVSYRGGHAIHLALLQSLPAQGSHWELIKGIPLSGISRAPVLPKTLSVPIHAATPALPV